jgi:hypothetical protein
MNLFSLLIHAVRRIYRYLKFTRHDDYLIRSYDDLTLR